MNNADIERQSESIETSNKIFISTRTLMIMTIVLAICRIVTIDIFLMISDLLTALMLYFYMQNSNQCMAIFVMINGVMGLFSSIGKTVQVFNFVYNNEFTAFSFISLLIVCYSILLYIIICIFSYFELNKPNSFQTDNFIFNQRAPTNANYGAIPTSEETNNNILKDKFVPFGGKGTTLG